MDSISICILNYNGKDYLEKCLKSVPLFIAGIKLEKILIDNSSTDESWKIAEKYGFKVIFADNQHKFITGLNTALKSFTSDAILFSQADLIFGAECIRYMTYTLCVNPHFIIQPVFWGEDSKTDNAGMKWIWPGYGIGIRTTESMASYPTDIVTSITFMVRRDVVEKIGLFDEQFSPAYYEDVDYSLRCKKYGIKRMVEGRSVVIHNHTSSFSRYYTKKQLSEICYQNRQKIIKKHYKGLDKLIRLFVIHAAQLLYTSIISLRNKIKAGFSLQS